MSDPFPGIPSAAVRHAAGDHAGAWNAPRNAAAATLLLALMIAAGSRGFRDFDGALTHYALGSLFALFAVVWRGTIWFERPPTRVLFLRALRNLREGGLRSARSGAGRAGIQKTAETLVEIARPIPSRFVAQDFIRRRGTVRWLAHLCLSGGSTMAFGITFPLVFGWVHFEAAASSPEVYVAHLFGLPVGRFPIHSFPAWMAFNALNLSAVLVLIGVTLAAWRRLRDPGERAVQTFAEDWLPLIILFAVASTGLALTIDARLMAGVGYPIWAIVHFATVIVLLMHIPFGKLFHMFQRSASWAVAVNKRAEQHAPRATCAACGGEHASAAQVEDLKAVTAALGFDFVLDAPGGPVHYQDVCPRCRRRLVARAQGRAMGR